MAIDASGRRERFVSLRISLRLAFQVCAALLVSVLPSSADFIATFGDIAVLAGPPSSVREGALESDLFLFAFGERENVTLPQDLRVSFTTPGLYLDRGDLPFPVPVLPAGTLVSSVFLHADPETRGIGYSGALTFDTDVLAVILGGILLEESDYLGSPGTSFPLDAFASGRGIALSGQDAIALTLDARTLIFDLTTRSAIDQVRVITAARTVPEPAISLLLGGGAIAALVARRRRGPGA